MLPPASGLSYAIRARASCLRSGGLILADMNLAALELDGSILEGKKRVVRAAADIKARLKLRSALADNDGAGGDKLSAVGFHATILSIAVAAVLGTALTFLMSHKSPHFQ